MRNVAKSVLSRAPGLIGFKFFEDGTQHFPLFIGEVAGVS